MKTLTKITALAAAAAFIGIGTASAQAYPHQQPGGYNSGQPGGFGPVAHQPYQQPAYNGVMGASPQVAALFTNTSYREIQGEMMAVAVYAPDGRCEVTIGGRTRGRSVTTQSCRYGVREIGQGRISMSWTAMINGQTMQDTSILRVRRDGSLFNEKQRTVAVRIG